MSVPNWRRNAQLFSAISTTDTVTATYEGPGEDGYAVVSFGTYDDDDSGLVQSVVSVRTTMAYQPRKGEPVVLTWTKGRLKLTGPARAKASAGTCVSTDFPDAVAEVNVGGTHYVLPYAVSIADTLKAGDPVAIDWTWDYGYIKDVVSKAPTDPGTTPHLSTDQKPFTLYFFAKQSGSRKSFNPPGAAPSYSKWWTQDVIADNDNVGGWFYGNVIRKTLRDDAYISSVEIYLPVRKTKGGLPNIGRHTQDKRPTGDDSLSVQDADTRHGRSGWVRLPVEWAETWRANAGGVAVNDGGTTTYKGIQANRQSGKLRIRGRQ